MKRKRKKYRAHLLDCDSQGQSKPRLLKRSKGSNDHFKSQHGGDEFALKTRGHSRMLKQGARGTQMQQLFLLVMVIVVVFSQVVTGFVVDSDGTVTMAILQQRVITGGNFLINENEHNSIVSWKLNKEESKILTVAECDDERKILRIGECVAGRVSLSVHTDDAPNTRANSYARVNNTARAKMYESPHGQYNGRGISPHGRDGRGKSGLYDGQGKGISPHGRENWHVLF
jgi:hypothetical protein